MNKKNMYIVLKREDVEKYLNKDNQECLHNLLEEIIKGREKDNKNPVNNYIVCNVDEPYAGVVHGVILSGEAAKASGKKCEIEACGSNQSKRDENNQDKVNWTNFLIGEAELTCETLKDAEILLKVCREHNINCSHVKADDYAQEPYWYIKNRELCITRYSWKEEAICSGWTVEEFIENHTY